MANHLVLKGSTWHARLDVPADIRHHPDFLGKKVLTKSTRTGDKYKANIAASFIVAKWKSRFVDIREGKDLTQCYLQGAEINLAMQENMRNAKNTAELLEVRIEADLKVEELIKKFGLTPDESGTLRQIVKENARPVNLINDRIIVDFEKYQSENKVLAKTAAGQASDIRKYIKYLDKNHLPMDHSSYGSFLQSLQITNATKRTKIASGNAFWKYLIKTKRASGKQESPFANHELPRSRKGLSTVKHYTPWTADEIKILYNEAHKRGDVVLANVIKISAYTGCRIEEICQIQTQYVYDDYFKITDGKSESSNRETPIHKDLKKLFAMLKNNSSNGYLIQSSAGSKYAIRSDSISKRFGRLKTSLGYGQSNTFHSIRSTTAQHLRLSGASLSLVQDILGHKRDMTSEVYIKSLIELKRKAISKLSFDINNL